MDEEGEFTIVELIIERKEGKDLCASITEGIIERVYGKKVSAYQ